MTSLGVLPRTGKVLLVALVALSFCCPGLADDLYRPGITQSLGIDRRASNIGDTVTVVIAEAAESSTSMQNGARKSSSILGHIGIGSFAEGADLSLGGSYGGRGEVRRSESFVTQMTASILEILPNGDYLIAGSQNLRINGERSLVEVRGRVRPIDIGADNRVSSNRMADAQITYDGKGFVSRSSKPGILQRIFSFLGLS